ncbi:PLP-dependent aminotransferase family protein [Cardiobacteriaceae bacterium TAE3-ERU3]|nr:PLP-dependent aminotransferase family protein [Cardiobacteriaceae bacterium TAE3-ERU3]
MTISMQPKTTQVRHWLSQRIATRQYPPNSRVPSIRALAKQLGFSPYTVTQAYEQLVAEGILHARSGSGFYVCPPKNHVRLPNPTQHNINDNVFDSGWLMRHLFHGFSCQRAPGSGLLPDAWLEQRHLGKIVRQNAERAAQYSYGYGQLHGYIGLREQFCRQLDNVGILAHPEQILTDNGVSASIVNIATTLLQPGDRVIVDDPGWFWLTACLQNCQFDVIGVPRDQYGPNIDLFEAALRDHGARLYISNSVLHNPTSHNLHPARAHQVLNLLHRYDAWLVEDDVYGAFDQHALRYATLDQLDRVFYVSGISKILGGSWRVGCIAAPTKHIEALLRQKMLSNMTCSELNERIVTDLSTGSHYRKHIHDLQQRLGEAHDNLRHWLHDSPFQLTDNQQPGLFVWLDTGMDSNELALLGKDANWLIAPGSLFHPDQRASTYIRLNIANTSRGFIQWLGCVSKT